MRGEAVYDIQAGNIGEELPGEIEIVPDEEPAPVEQPAPEREREPTREPVPA